MQEFLDDRANDDVLVKSTFRDPFETFHRELLGGGKQQPENFFENVQNGSDRKHGFDRFIIATI